MKSHITDSGFRSLIIIGSVTSMQIRLNENGSHSAADPPKDRYFLGGKTADMIGLYKQTDKRWGAPERRRRLNCHWRDSIDSINWPQTAASVSLTNFFFLSPLLSLSFYWCKNQMKKKKRRRKMRMGGGYNDGKGTVIKLTVSIDADLRRLKM